LIHEDTNGKLYHSHFFHLGAAPASNRALAERGARSGLRIARTISHRNFGVGTDMHTGPTGNLFVVSVSNGAIYEIFRAR
jgi:hypothetical protein